MRGFNFNRLNRILRINRIAALMCSLIIGISMLTAQAISTAQDDDIYSLTIYKIRNK